MADDGHPARALKLQFLPHPCAQARRTGSVEAHDPYLRGLHFWDLRTIESLTRAAGFFMPKPGRVTSY